MTPLTISAVRLETRGNRLVLSGLVGDERLFWDMPPRPSISIRGEPFLSLALVPAMTTGRDLLLPDDVPVGESFLHSITELQEIFVRWFPGLRPVTIHADRVEPRVGASGRFAGYSGGVDSSYTVLRTAAELDGVVLIDGIEFRDANEALMRSVAGRLAKPLAERGLALHTVVTNTKAVGRALGGDWSEFIGGALASVPHALGVEEYWIAGSNSWENLRPYGTHPFTDPLYGSANVRIHHHGGEARRIDKIAALMAAPDLMAELRVCFQGGQYNCGVCHKCLQTSAALRALGGTSAALPALDRPRLLRALEVMGRGDLVDWQEILECPGLEDRDRVLHRELDRLIRRYQWRQALTRLDAVATRGRVRRLWDRLLPGRTPLGPHPKP